MDCNISPFQIAIVFSKQYTFTVEQTYMSENIEIFTVTWNNRKIQFQSDRPFLRKTGGKKRINWKVVNGKVENEDNYERIKLELEKHIKSIEKPPFDWSSHPKNS